MPRRFLSSEWDLVYVNQPEETKEGSWENLSASCSGRSAVIPHPRIIGDPNPAGSKHWILRRADEKKLRLIKTTHKDNPTIYNEDGTITEGGKMRLETLSNYTGVRRKRLFEGIWATAEGTVYDMFDRDIHVRPRDMSDFKQFGLAVDMGYTHPAAIVLIGIDEDGRWHICKEFYETGKLQEEIVNQVREWYFNAYTPPQENDKSPEPIKCTMVVVDEAAAGLIAEIRNSGIPAVGAKGKVFGGIFAIQDRLKVQGDSKPRLTVDPSCVNTINEFESYVWKPGKDEPVKENDHCFVGDTKVITKRGYINISEITPNDFVWSPFGWNRVIRSGSTGIKTVKDYGVFVSTPNHKIPTNNGIKEVDALGNSDIIMLWKNQRPYTFWEFLTAAIQSPRIEIMRFILGGSAYKSKGNKTGFLHRDVWEHYNGKIPDGYLIHHVDGDPGNNDISNLELVSISEHAKRHHWGIWDGSKKHLDSIRPLTKEWHSSKEGKEWHSKHSKEQWKSKKYYKRICQVCGKEYETPYPNRSKYCNPNCKATALRRRRGIQPRY